MVRDGRDWVGDRIRDGRAKGRERYDKFIEWKNRVPPEKPPVEGAFSARTVYLP
jgi:hypothetical protein